MLPSYAAAPASGRHAELSSTQRSWIHGVGVCARTCLVFTQSHGVTESQIPGVQKLRRRSSVFNSVNNKNNVCLDIVASETRPLRASVTLCLRVETRKPRAHLDDDDVDVVAAGFSLPFCRNGTPSTIH